MEVLVSESGKGRYTQEITVGAHTLQLPPRLFKRDRSLIFI